MMQIIDFNAKTNDYALTFENNYRITPHKGAGAYYVGQNESDHFFFKVEQIRDGVLFLHINVVKNYLIVSSSNIIKDPDARVAPQIKSTEDFLYVMVRNSKTLVIFQYDLGTQILINSFKVDDGIFTTGFIYGKHFFAWTTGTFIYSYMTVVPVNSISAVPEFSLHRGIFEWELANPAYDITLKTYKFSRYTFSTDTYNTDNEFVLHKEDDHIPDILVQLNPIYITTPNTLDKFKISPITLPVNPGNLTIEYWVESMKGYNYPYGINVHRYIDADADTNELWDLPHVGSGTQEFGFKLIARPEGYEKQLEQPIYLEISQCVSNCEI
jgi:hypothetical protein